jgi:hypothetical protein
MGTGGFQNYVPIITSVFAIAISSLTLGWTIYRDAIRKPKFRVTAAVNKIVQAGRQPEGPLFIVEALNLGPIPNRIGLTFARKSWIKRKLTKRESGRAFIYPDFRQWATTQSSTRLEVGDTARYVFPYNERSFLKEDFCQIGVADGFGQIHWTKRSDFRKLRQKFLKDFPSAATSNTASADEQRNAQQA